MREAPLGPRGSCRRRRHRPGTPWTRWPAPCPTLPSSRSRVNRIFPTKDVLLEMVEKLKKLDAALVRCTNSSRQVVLKCRHGIQRKSLCTGARPNQSFNFCGCPVCISISLQKNLQWQVVYSNLKHDFHAVGEEVNATYVCVT